MKRLLIIVFIIPLILFGCTVKEDYDISASDYLRIHIRANSNDMKDQNIKYMVKDSIVEYLSPIIAECESKDAMIDSVYDNLSNIEDVANNMLAINGFTYKSNAYLSEEYFPTRVYGDITLDADVYDAMTAARVYRGALCPFKVIEMFGQEGLSMFDAEYILVFLENIVQTYIKNWVRLSNGREGEIVMLNKHKLSRPVILCGTEFINLADHPEISIEEVLI